MKSVCLFLQIIQNKIRKPIDFKFVTKSYTALFLGKTTKFQQNRKLRDTCGYITKCQHLLGRHLAALCNALIPCFVNLLKRVHPTICSAYICLLHHQCSSSVIGQLLLPPSGLTFTKRSTNINNMNLIDKLH